MVKQKKSIRKDRYWLQLSSEGKVTLHHVDMGGAGQALAWDDEYIAVKWPRGKHWAGNYQEREYHPPKTVVYRIIEERSDMIVLAPPNGPHGMRVEKCVEWSHERKAKLS